MKKQITTLASDRIANLEQVWIWYVHNSDGTDCFAVGESEEECKAEEAKQVKLEQEAWAQGEDWDTELDEAVPRKIEDAPSDLLALCDTVSGVYRVWLLGEMCVSGHISSADFRDSSTGMVAWIKHEDAICVIEDSALWEG